jgi:hypothetical protein
MMRRCYNQNDKDYKRYGAKGITVSKEWHSAVKFASDAQKLPHWEYKLNDWNNFTLDKDYYGSNQYNKDCCVWLSNQDNATTNHVEIIKTDGTSKWFISMAEAGRFYGISSLCIARYCKEGLPNFLRFNAEKLRDCKFNTKLPEGMLLRKEIIIN